MTALHVNAWDEVVGKNPAPYLIFLGLCIEFSPSVCPLSWAHDRVATGRRIGFRGLLGREGNSDKAILGDCMGELVYWHSWNQTFTTYKDACVSSTS